MTDTNKAAIPREDLIALLRENLPLTCGRNCEAMITTTGETEAYEMTADAILSRHPVTAARPEREVVARIVHFVHGDDLSLEAALSSANDAHWVHWRDVEPHGAEAAFKAADAILSLPVQSVDGPVASCAERLLDEVQTAIQARDVSLISTEALKALEAALDAPVQSVEAEPVAWAFEIATHRIWEGNKPVGWGGWEARISKTEPHAGDGMRNVVPLGPIAASAPESAS